MKKSIYYYKLIILLIIINLNYIIFKYNNLKKQNYILQYKNKSLRIYKNHSRIIAISYGNEKYQRQLKVNRKSALEIGMVDEYYNYGPNDIDNEFKKKNIDILSQKRGNGYWLWKPYFILKTFKEKMNEGDFIIYTDAGILYLNSTYNIIDFMKKKNAEMWGIQMPFRIEKIWTKRDAFILLCLDSPFYSETPQYMAGIQIYRKSKFTEKFLEDLLYYSQDKRIITDMPNTLGKKNYKGFIENRHDQSIFSLLIKKYGLVNTPKTNMNIKKNNESLIKMRSIFCIYRMLKFKDYNDIMNKCKEKYKTK